MVRVGLVDGGRCCRHRGGSGRVAILRRLRDLLRPLRGLCVSAARNRNQRPAINNDFPDLVIEILRMVTLLFTSRYDAQPPKVPPL
jgi:hypothetical protein